MLTFQDCHSLAHGCMSNEETFLQDSLHIYYSIPNKGFPCTIGIVICLTCSNLQPPNIESTATKKRDPKLNSLRSSDAIYLKS